METIRKETKKLERAELNCKVLKSTLLYVKKRYGEKLLAQLIQDTGQDLNYLQDENNWVSWSYYRHLLKAVADTTQDPKAPFEAGTIAATKEAWGSTYTIFRFFGTVKFTIKKVVEMVPNFNKAALWELLELKRNEAVIKITWKEGIETDRYACENRHGQMASIPNLFDMPMAKVQELQCQAQGAPYCVDIYTWLNRPRRILGVMGLAISLPLVMVSLIILPKSTLNGITGLLLMLVAYTVGRLLDYRKIIKENTLMTEEQNEALEKSVTAITKKYDELQAANEELEKTHAELQKHRDHLEELVQERTRELQTANEKLKDLDQAKSRFFSNITHEFRTPLVALSSTIQMIMEGGLKDSVQQEKLLGDSRAFLDDMLENVNDLLMLTKSQKGLLEITWSELEIASFVDRTVKAFESAAKSSHNRLKFTNKLEKPINIYTDRAKLKKVLNNLIGNALKFTKDGEVEVVVGASPSPNPSHQGRGNAGTCEIQVRDTGRGIPKEDLATLFDPFTQASNNPLREVQGTGLGLATVKEFVEKLSGKVSVQSEVGKGSIFTVELPLGDRHIDKTKLDTTNLTEDENIKINLGLKNFDEVDLSHLRGEVFGRDKILIVEDNSQIIQILGYVLKDYYNLDFAKDGEEGLQKVKAQRPALIISDIMMPKMNGYELAHAIKTDEELKLTPVILLTSKADIESKIKGYEEGADEYLSKPFNNREILTRVKGLIERRKLEIQFFQSGKLASIGVMVAGIAHHFNNKIHSPIQGVDILRNRIERVKTGNASFEEIVPDVKEVLEIMEEELDAVRVIVQDLLVASHHGATQMNIETVDLNQILQRGVRILKAGNAARIQFHETYGTVIPIQGDSIRLEEVFINLIKNASDAILGNGNIWIKTWQESNFIFASVRDDGVGISKEDLDKIFDLFFTTKPVGSGTGLGLSVSHATIQAHGGEIQVKSKVGEGTEFIVKLPVDRKRSS
ncbi:MAG: response regulator [Chlamydiae bacterium]|nr:response regulator [Chlamydiota bacterium]MBI3266623.1 response regulator [Chlamydiota bacterium]